LLNPSLDPAALGASYRVRNRLQIPDILVPSEAERLHVCLTQETPWGVVYNEGGQVVQVMADQLRALPQAEGARLVSGAIARARTGFQFLYHFYPMLSAYQAGRDPGLYLHSVLERINAEPFLAFVRQVTGIPTLVRADAQATLYAPGHFLTRHDDSPNVNLNRRVAYVLSMTRNWHPDYGALLQFYDDANAVTDVFVPRFNTLSLFTVPQMHAVTYTAPFAPVGRFAITGWFQDP
jgi:Rps23 Pro-64 3,4-dihydroxylase Tpa1-like proline 4-hydroxylase